VFEQKECFMEPVNDRKLLVIFDVHYRLTDAERQLLHADLEGLARQVAHFPVADLRVLIEGNARTNDVAVKLTLLLPGTTLVVHEADPAAHTAFLRCVDSLLYNLQAYKDRLGNVAEIQKTAKGTHQELHSPIVIDGNALQCAVDEGNYAAFRIATFALEEGLRKRVGRWVQRYADFEARIGKGIEIDDVVEDVFLEAFESYPHRSQAVPFGDWLEGLIDPAINALRNHTDDELENIRMARTALALELRQSTP
jgi:ribosome-associated translation inhibitor RaiA